MNRRVHYKRLYTQNLFFYNNRFSGSKRRVYRAESLTVTTAPEFGIMKNVPVLASTSRDLSTVNWASQSHYFDFVGALALALLALWISGFVEISSR